MTTIHVKNDTWKRLNRLKMPGESMDDVVRRLLNHSETRKTMKHLNNEEIEKLVEKYIEAVSDIDETVELMRDSWKRKT